jgi:uncharacterized membrane protein (UPF0182 family)
MRILRLPGNTQIPGPSQIANQFAADQEIQDALLAFTRTNSKALFGNLLTLPVGDGLLYVQPLYTLRESGEGTYPVLRYVLVSFGKDVGFGPTLAAALDDVLGITGTDQSLSDGETGNGNGNPPPSGQPLPGDIESLLQQAEAKFAEAEQALQSGDLQGYADAQQEARDLVEQALELAGASPSAKPSPSDGASPSGSASPSEGSSSSPSPSDGQGQQG